MEEKAVFDSLLEKEESLREKATDLKSDLEGLNSKIVSKQSEIDCLLAKVAQLKSNKRKFKFSSEENNGKSHQERKRIKLNHEWVIEPGRLAETLLHEEVWREVFSKMNDGLDLLNASRTCQHFCDILNPTKTTFLFGEVLPILIPHLDFSDVLNSRLVCKDWNSAIKTNLTDWAKIEMSYLTCLGSYHPSAEVGGEVSRAYTFEIDGRDPNHFLQQFNSSQRNPFITNSIVIQESLYDDREFYEGISSILETFGKCICHLKWEGDFFANPRRGLDVPVLIHKLFRNSQNLQSLELVNPTELDQPIPQVDDEPYSLPNLETLIINMEPTFPFANWLFKNFHLQIKELQLYNYKDLASASKFIWPEVAELSLTHFSKDVGEKDYLKSLESFPNLNKLCFNLRVFSGNKLLKILRIVESLPAICQSFCSLYISCGGGFKSEYLDQLRNHANLVAPKEITNLELKLLGTYYMRLEEFDFAFLLQFPHIRKLSVIYEPGCFRERESMQENKVEIVEVLKYMATNSHPRSSNAWRMLPSLETLQLQNKIYKRPKTFHTK